VQPGFDRSEIEKALLSMVSRLENGYSERDRARQESDELSTESASFCLV
jgi:hypothetical protein